MEGKDGLHQFVDKTVIMITEDLDLKDMTTTMITPTEIVHHDIMMKTRIAREGLLHHSIMTILTREDLHPLILAYLHDLHEQSDQRTFITVTECLPTKTETIGPRRDAYPLMQMVQESHRQGAQQK